jgi:hypothetical protein
LESGRVPGKLEDTNASHRAVGSKEVDDQSIGLTLSRRNLFFQAGEPALESPGHFSPWLAQLGDPAERTFPVWPGFHSIIGPFSVPS